MKNSVKSTLYGLVFVGALALGNSFSDENFLEKKLFQGFSLFPLCSSVLYFKKEVNYEFESDLSYQ